jgi:hypothetical protein
MMHGRWEHDCPECGVRIQWALAYCSDCRGYGKKANEAWKPPSTTVYLGEATPDGQPKQRKKKEGHP